MTSKTRMTGCSSGVLTKGHRGHVSIAIVRRGSECKMTDVIVSGEVGVGFEVRTSQC